MLLAALGSALVVPLSACGVMDYVTSPKPDDVTPLLRKAVRSSPAYISGEVSYQNGLDQGHRIVGVIKVTGSTKDEVTESLRRVLRSIAVAIKGIDFPDSAIVSMDGYSRADSEVRADASEALDVTDVSEPSIAQLRSYFHLS
jgi:hypothetical protein